MTTRDASRRFSHLWQVPLLLVSLCVSACAACLFIEARPVITLNQKLAPARELIARERPDAAIESLHRLVASQQIPREGQAQIHLLLAEAIDASQRQRRERAKGASAADRKSVV